METALRYNSGKLRYDLLEPYALQELVKVFTKGSEKYEDHNWQKGMKWSAMLASLKRHLAAFEMGEDRDAESNINHMAHVAWNAMGLVTYSKTHPEFDDRQHSYLKRPRIGLDIDNVIADWTIAWGTWKGIPKQPESWRYNYNNSKWLTPSPELDEFYRTIPPAIKPSDIPFEPHAYITARSIDETITKQWLQDNGFPTAPLYTVPFGGSKVDVAIKAGIEWFIDDSYDNFVELNRSGICTFLWDQPHNRRYNVGYRRIKDFKDFKDRFL
jgi:hypothetical protein